MRFRKLVTAAVLVALGLMAAPASAVVVFSEALYHPGQRCPSWKSQRLVSFGYANHGCRYRCF